MRTDYFQYHGLLAEAAHLLIQRASYEALSEVRGCNEHDANAARLIAYAERVAFSADPLASEEQMARRAIAGLRIQAAMRKRERIRHLRARIRAVPLQAAAPLPANVVQLTARQRP